MPTKTPLITPGTLLAAVRVCGVALATQSAPRRYACCGDMVLQVTTQLCVGSLPPVKIREEKDGDNVPLRTGLR